MPTNKAQLKAAERFAKQNDMSVHDAFRTPEFQESWNDLVRHPYNPSKAKRLGLRRKLVKEGEDDENMFCKHESVRRYTVVWRIKNAAR